MSLAANHVTTLAAFVSWFDWAPDPERAHRAHDPMLEPYASMTKEQLREAMLDAHGGAEWDFIQEFFLDKCSEAERAVDRLTFLQEQFGVLGDETLLFLSGVAGRATRLAPGSDDRDFCPCRGLPPGS
jgi:hypothetical protein